MTRRNLYQATGPELLLAAEFDVTAAISEDASNYWTLRFRHVKEGQENGEEIGEEFSSASRSVDANTRIRLLDDFVELSDGDVIAIVGEETGSPAALEGLSAWMKVQRSPR